MTSPTPPAGPGTSLAAALAQLVSSGVAGGLDAAAVRAEGAGLAAAVAEASPGAPAAWLAETGNKGTATFFAAASAARRWRSGPTDLLQVLRTAGSPEAADAYADALGGVAIAAVTLGAGGPQTVSAAFEAASAQRGLPPVASGTPAVPGTSAPVLAPGLDGLVSSPVGRTSSAFPELPDAWRLTPLTAVPDVESILRALQGMTPGAPGAGALPAGAGQPALTGQP
ncbi:MAG: ATPase, partial [Salana multivorans]|nr:ATPase [Salana multivorans]